MKKTVLILDDNTMMGAFLTKLLQNEFETLFLSDSVSALKAMVSGLRPDLILLDYSLDDMNGVDWLKIIHQKNSVWTEVPVLMISGSKDANIRIEALKNGASDFLQKPFHPHELLLRVEKVLENIQSKHTHTPTTV